MRGVIIIFLNWGIIFILIIIFLGIKTLEKIRVKKYWGDIPLRIHVNGTRGKSTVVRFLVSGLGSGGYKVIGKTTGEIPELQINGEKIPIHRRAPANIKEQVTALRKGAISGVDVLVTECMAINPELQKASESFLGSQIGIITGFGPDHIDVYGESSEKISEGLSGFIPKEGKVFLMENDLPFFRENIADRNSEAVAVSWANSEEIIGLNHIDKNISLALGVCEYLGVPREKAFPAIKEEAKKINLLYKIKANGSAHLIINAFSANDPESTLNLYQDIEEKEEPNLPLLGIFNNRNDRSFRLKTFARFLEMLPFREIIIIGDYHRHLKNWKSEKYRVKNMTGETKFMPKEIIRSLESDHLILCFGNYHKKGRAFIDFIEQEGKKCNLIS